MIILAIDTSCDDTCVALLKAKNSRFRILANIVSSQVKIHKKWGGVVPTLAKREHQKNLPLVFKKALKKAKSASRRTKIDASTSSVSILSDSRRIDLIAVTAGPGLEPCLWAGVNFAKDLAKKLTLKIIPINHIEAHILANWLRPIGSNFKNIFPAICLVVSGGHTQLILMREVGKYKILGETRDDAAGECFDKVAKILGLGYPGGPIVAKMATKFKNRASVYRSEGEEEDKALSAFQKPKHQTIHLPRPMIFQKNYDFSFSGLKTAVLYNFRAQSPKIRKSKKYIQEMCFEAQQAIIDVLIKKTIRAVKEFRVKTVILGGGVAANKELRRQFKEKIKKEIPYSKWGPQKREGGGRVVVYIPDSKFCTDNAAMVGVTAYFHWVKGKFLKNWSAITVNANLKIS